MLGRRCCISAAAGAPTQTPQLARSHLVPGAVQPWAAQLGVHLSVVQRPRGQQVEHAFADAGRAMQGEHQRALRLCLRHVVAHSVADLAESQLLAHYLGGEVGLQTLAGARRKVQVAYSGTGWLAGGRRVAGAAGGGSQRGTPARSPTDRPQARCSPENKLTMAPTAATATAQPRATAMPSAWLVQRWGCGGHVAIRYVNRIDGW